MAKAKKLPSGAWRTQVYVGKDAAGKRIYKSFTDENKKKSEYAAAEYAVKHKEENKSENLSLQDAINKYIDNKSNMISPASIRGYRIMQRNSYPLMLTIPIGKIVSTNLVQRQMNENAKRYSAKSMSNQVKFITAVMNYFNISLGKIALKPQEHNGISVPTKEEAEKIMSLLRSAPDIECQALLALTCSLRQSEIAALTAECIDGNIARIHGACVPDENNKIVYKETNKSAAGTRNIVMPEYLSNRISELCHQKVTGRLFVLTPMQVLTRFKKLLSANGMPTFTIHSLRHCFAAIMHAQNIPDRYVMEMGGWASNNVLKRVYQYTFEDEVQKSKQIANKYFDNALSDDMQHETQHDDKKV